MARAEIVFDDAELRYKLEHFDRDLTDAVHKLFDYEAAYATAALKTRAPWTDRTGAARSGLMAVPNQISKDEWELLMSYSVYYGIYLELANSGKYAVIIPFQRVMGRKLMRDMTHLIDRMGR